MTKLSIVALVGGMLWAGAIAGAREDVPQGPPDPAKVAEGKATFEGTKCFLCHGPEGKGDKTGKLSILGVSAKLPEADIRKWITAPAEMTAKLATKPLLPMKKFDLTDAQVDGLVAYVQSLKK